jgi:lipoprotein-anchoring transpeptidase ErfK/SrfK
MSIISRRDFLKLNVAALAGLIFAPLDRQINLTDEQQGRVLDASINLHDRPSFLGQILETYWKDMLLTITETTIGDEEPAFNRVWYQINGKGYVHSGAVQPVRTLLNPPVQDIPGNGALAEVTVPYTDAHWKPDKRFPVAYRFYYETTHWVKQLVPGDDGQPWYHLLNDKWEVSYYVPASHLRIIPYDELAPLSPDLPLSAKRIEVLTADQAVVAYEWDQPVFMTRTATGARFSNGNYATPPGIHITNHKRPSRHMARGNLAYNGYDLPGVPWVTYITESGISFHGTYWHNNFGRPRSHGCINLTPQAAKWLYRWSLPVVPPEEPGIYKNYGTKVEVI